MLSATDNLQAIELTLNRLMITKYVNGVAFVYFALEYFHTLELEVAYVWGDKLSPVKVLFFVTRYLGFFTNGLLMWFFGPSPRNGVEVCTKLYWLTLLAIGVTITAADAIICVRIHALSRRSKRMAIFLSIHFVAVFSGFYTLMVLDLKMTRLSESPFPSHLTCLIVYRDFSRVISLLSLVLYNTVFACVLSFWLSFRNYRDSRSPILRVFYVNGTFHFAMMAAVTSAHIALVTAGPVEFHLLLAGVHQAVHTTFSARILLFMREAARRDTDISCIAPTDLVPLDHLVCSAHPSTMTITRTALPNGVHVQSVVQVHSDVDSDSRRSSATNPSGV